jgi:hypothetical protein
MKTFISGNQIRYGMIKIESVDETADFFLGHEYSKKNPGAQATGALL